MAFEIEVEWKAKSDLLTAETKREKHEKTLSGNYRFRGKIIST